MPEDGQPGRGNGGTEAVSATRVGPAGWPSGSGATAARPGGTRDRVPWLIAGAVFAVYTAVQSNTQPPGAWMSAASWRSWADAPPNAGKKYPAEVLTPR
jgi:hypothetical protein